MDIETIIAKWGANPFVQKSILVLAIFVLLTVLMNLLKRYLPGDFSACPERSDRRLHAVCERGLEECRVVGVPPVDVKIRREELS